MKILITIILTLCLLISGHKKEDSNAKPLLETSKKDSQFVNNYQDIEIPVIEGYPQARIEAIEAELESLKKVREKVDDLTYRSFISSQKTWNAGDVITVAFNGGAFEVKQKIEAIVKSWSDVANIKFDFRNPSQPDTYREWTKSDGAYRADIRIAFDSNNQIGLYWSAIGRESIKDYCDANSIAKSCYFPNDPSMNLGGLGVRLTQNLEAIVLHEFGHAIGFLHEHQSLSSTCEEEFRWDNDTGYIETKNGDEFIPDGQGKRPGIYTYYQGSPNRWRIPTIDFNLRKFPRSGGWEFSALDKSSIMKYYFERWMFKNIAISTDSGCYSTQNVTLSTQDKIAAAEAYPRSSVNIQRVTNERLKVSDKILKLKNLPAELKAEIKENIRVIKNQK